MDDIIREGNPALREVAEGVSLPLGEENFSLRKETLEFSKNSQDPIEVEKLHLQGGVGSAASRLDISKRIIAAHVPNADPKADEPSLSTVMYNPKILSHSARDARLGEGEGCLPIDREVPGYIVRHAKIAMPYYDANGEKHKIRLENHESIAIQHEIDHVNGMTLYDYINDQNPFALKEGVLVVEQRFGLIPRF